MTHLGVTDDTDAAPSRPAIPLAVIIGIGTFGATVNAHLRQVLDRLGPGAKALIRTVTIQPGMAGDDIHVTVDLGEEGQSEVAADDRSANGSAPPAVDSQSWLKLLHDSRDKVMDAVRQCLDEVTSPRAAELANQNGVDRYMFGESVALSVFIAADVGDVRTGPWVLDVAGLCLEASSGGRLGPGVRVTQIGCLNLAEALTPANVADEQEAAARAHLRLAEIDALLAGIPEEFESPFFSISPQDRPHNRLFDLVLLRRPTVHSSSQHAAACCATAISFQLLHRAELDANQTLRQLFNGDHGGYLPRDDGMSRRYGTIGVAEIYYPEEQFVDYAACRLGIRLLQEQVLAPSTAAPNAGANAWSEVLSRTKLAHGQFASYKMAFCELITTDADGKPLRAPDFPSAVLDDREMGEWPAKLASYEILAMSNMRGVWERMRSNAEAATAKIADGLHRQVDGYLGTAAEGLAGADGLVDGARRWLSNMQEEASRDEQPPLVSTDAAFERLRKAIEEVPTPWALLSRVGLIACFAFALTRGIGIELGLSPAQGTLAGGGVALALLILGLVFYKLRWDDVTGARLHVLSEIQRKRESGLRLYSWKLFQASFGQLNDAVSRETGRLRRLRETIAAVEDDMWVELKGIVGARGAWRTFSDILGPLGAQDAWGGSKVLDDLTEWGGEPPQDTLPCWEAGGPSVSVLASVEFPQFFTDDEQNPAINVARRDLLQSFLDTRHPLGEWRPRDEADEEEHWRRLEQTLRRSLADWASGRYDHWRAKTVDTLLRERGDGYCRERWQDELLPYSTPTVATNVADFEENAQPDTAMLTFTPEPPQSPLAALASEAGFESLRSHLKNHAVVLRGTFGFPIDRADFSSRLTTNCTEFIKDKARAGSIEIEERRQLLAGHVERDKQTPRGDR